MVNKVTQEDILNINRLYLKYKTYAETARQCGFSAGTVKKYIIKDFIDPDTVEKKEFSSTILPVKKIEINWNLTLSKEEDKEIKELWKEISL
jgi:DNA invertase Pin-like site-specific DNA recombinase